MMRSSPGGMPPQNLSTSGRQICTIRNRRCGSINGRGVSGGTAGAATAAGACGGSTDGGDAGLNFAAGAVAGFFATGGFGTAGEVADGVCGGGGAAGATTGAGAAAGAGAGGRIALTAALQAGESLAKFCFKQSSASLPPGVTPEQFAMKSDRQEARMALR